MRERSGSSASTTGEGGAGSRSARLTALLPVGAVAGRGTTLYSADGEPVVALLAPDPLFRDLTKGIEDGDDVRWLEENLSALGYGGGLAVDRHFDAATAAAVESWEQTLGRRDPDGAVSVGEVVFLPEPAAVVSHPRAVGDKIDVGTTLLSIGSESRVVTVSVPVMSRAIWAVGTVVTLSWGEVSASGTVTEVGRDETGGHVEITIVPGGGTLGLPVGTEVEAVATTAERTGVVTVPVSAIRSVAGGTGLLVVGERGDRPAPVEIGVVAGGLAEIVEGLAEGTRVRLPG